MQVLIAVQHAALRAGFSQFLGGLNRKLQVAEAATIDDAIAALSRTPAPELALIDLDMPGVDDAALARFAELAPAARLVALSNNVDPAVLRRAFDAGFAGCLPKSARAEIVASALNIVLSGERYAPVIGFDRPAAPRRPARTVAEAQAGYSPLTRRQRDIMRLLAQGKSNRDIAKTLGIAEGTVKVHVANIFKALDVNNRTAAAAAARKLGVID